MTASRSIRSYRKPHNESGLRLPDPDEALQDIPEYNDLLNNKNVPHEQTGLNLLFPIHF